MTRTRANIMLIGQKPGETGRANKYDPEHCMTIRLLAQQGRFPESWCAELGVTMNTLYNWGRAHPEFNEAVMISWHLLHDYWTRYTHDNLTNPNLKTAPLLEILHKRFPETWGREARNTMATFVNSIGVTEEDSATIDAQPLQPDQAQHMTDDDITARLNALRRRNEEAEKP